MIERLTTTLRALAFGPWSGCRSDDGRRLVADCADALRLELDCPQEDLGSAEREALATLGDALERMDDQAIRATARDVSRTLRI